MIINENFKQKPWSGQSSMMREILSMKFYEWSITGLMEICQHNLEPIES